MKLKDQLQREIFFEEFPNRIISLVPSQTELLVDLGLEASILGITKFCVHPEYLRKKKQIVGGTKHINLDKIKALKPKIILCNKEENTLEMVTQLELIAPVHVSDISNVQDNLELIEQYGKIFKVEDRANRISSKIIMGLENFRAFVSSLPKLRVVYLIWRKPCMVVASGTFINSILELNELDNIYSDLERYPQIKLNELEERQPEVIMLSSEPYPFNTKHRDDICKRFPNATVVLVDGEYFSWYGSRLIKSLDYFKTLRLDIEV